MTLAQRTGEYEYIIQNKTKYNSYVKGQRLTRIKQQKLAIMNAKTQKMKEIIESGNSNL